MGEKTIPVTGGCLCGAIADRRESAYGYKRSSNRPKSTSALPPASDILGKAGKV